MGVFGRFGYLMKAKFSRVLDRAENPNDSLDYSYEKMLESLQGVKRGIADVVTAKKRLELQATQIENNIAKLEGQARDAVSKGRDDLATHALEKKAALQTQLESMQPQIEALKGQQANLEVKQKELQQKIETFRMQKEVIKAQYTAAEAQVRVASATTGIGDHAGGAARAIERAKEKTQEMQARAAAMDELTANGTFEDVLELTNGVDPIDRELSAISASARVENDLARIKGELGVAPAAEAIGAGNSIPADHEVVEPAAVEIEHDSHSL